MIFKEFFDIIEETRLVRSYSDLGYKIRKIGTNEIYDEAVDLEDAGYEYEEIKEDDDK
jgi:hypothetical protein